MPYSSNIYASQTGLCIQIHYLLTTGLRTGNKFYFQFVDMFTTTIK